MMTASIYRESVIRIRGYKGGNMKKNALSETRKIYLQAKRKVYGLPEKKYKGYMSKKEWEKETYKVDHFSNALLDPDSCFWFLDL